MAELTESRYAETRGKQLRDISEIKTQWNGNQLSITAPKGVSIEVICGPLQKMNNSTFKVYPYECGLDNPRRSYTAWLIAILDGDKTNKRVVKPIEIKIPH